MSFKKILVWALSLYLFCGCQKNESSSEVVIYTALDRMFSEPILKKFEAQTGIKVRVKYDTENTKTVGLTAALIEQKSRPICDVFWNNEIINTIRLQKLGILEVHSSVATNVIPPQYRDPEGYWTGFAARARVLLVNTEKISLEKAPKTLKELSQPQWAKQCGIARPIAGTTASHIACLFASWGVENAKNFLLQLRKNGVHIESGNKACARKVASGELAMALTDTDDAMIEILENKPVAIVYLDRDSHDFGTLFIPNTLALIRNSPHQENGKKLIDFLLSPEVEEILALCPSQQIPLNPKVKMKLSIPTPHEISVQKVDFRKAADLWESSRQFITQKFLP